MFMQSIFDKYPYNLYTKHIAQKLKEINDRLLLDYDLNTSQGILLWHINQSIEEHIEINRKFLEESMNLSGPSVTNLLNGLEKMGFITRSNSSSDGRNLYIEVTAKTKQLIQDMSTAFDKSEELLAAGMSDAEKVMFVSLLTRASENADKYQLK
jgi:DNA-binding MarR family transcriptional regulator